MDDHSEKIKLIERTIFLQEDKIKELSHKVDLELAAALSSLKNVIKSHSHLNARLEKHLDKDEEITKEIYRRFDSLDEELKDSFEKRDDKIVDLQIDSAKVNTKQLIYASVAFTAINIVILILRNKGII